MKSLEVLITGAFMKWGEGSQIDMAIEECAELTVALQHYKRSRISWDKVVEEIVDVDLMIEQMKYITAQKCFADEYKHVRELKIKRLATLLEVKP